MLNQISFSNFKSWKELPPIKIGKITGFFGSNSSGKTSILNSLLLLKQTVESSDRKQVLNFGDDREYIQLGSFNDIIFNHINTNSIDFNINFRLDALLNIASIEERGNLQLSDDKIDFFTSISQATSKRMYVNEFRYNFSENSFIMKKQQKEKYSYAISSKPLLKDKKKIIFKREMGRAWELPDPIKFYGFPDQIRTYYQNAGFLFDLQLALEDQFSKILYLGPLREYPKRTYIWTGTQPSDMGIKGERYVEAILVSRERGDKISRGAGAKRFTVEEYVAFWLKKLGIIYSFSVNEIKDGTNLYQVRVRKTQNSAPVFITDVGFGVSQIVPIITLCYYAPEGSTIIIEQPEIHLHPLVQSGLADIFIDTIHNRNIQIIIESHSEHLLRRLQRRIAEEQISNDDVSLYFCSMGEYQSRITPIKMNLFGNIENWPDDFFGNEYEEIASMNKAIIQRKRNEK